MTDQDRQRINTYLMEIAQGNFVALDGLSCLVSARMLSVALAIVKNRQSAEDIVQDSFVTVLKKAKTFKPDTNGYAWICKIVHNTAINSLRKERRRCVNIDDLFSLSDDNVSQQQLENTVAVKQAMSVLDSTEKWLIYQKYFMDFTVRDSAKSVGKSKSTVQRIIQGAEEKMKQYFNNQGTLQ